MTSIDRMQKTNRELQEKESIKVEVNIMKYFYKSLREG